jgi:hypothetical protein
MRARVDPGSRPWVSRTRCGARECGEADARAPVASASPHPAASRPAASARPGVRTGRPPAATRPPPRVLSRAAAAGGVLQTRPRALKPVRVAQRGREIGVGQFVGHTPGSAKIAGRLGRVAQAAVKDAVCLLPLPFRLIRCLSILPRPIITCSTVHRVSTLGITMALARCLMLISRRDSRVLDGDGDGLSVVDMGADEQAVAGATITVVPDINRAASRRA